MRREDRRAKALRLSMLGWTQVEIAERLNVSRDTIAEDLSEKFGTKDFLQSGHPQEEIAERERIDHRTVSDVLAEMAELPKSLKPHADHLVDFEVPIYNIWTQEEIGERLGVSKPTVNEIVRKFNSEDSELFTSGHPPEEIGARLGGTTATQGRREVEGIGNRKRERFVRTAKRTAAPCF